MAKNTAHVSPKVTTATVGSAVAVLVLYALARVPALADLPGEVQAALTLLVTAGVTFASGYVRRDRDRL